MDEERDSLFNSSLILPSDSLFTSKDLLLTDESDNKENECSFPRGKETIELLKYLKEVEDCAESFNVDKIIPLSKSNNQISTSQWQFTATTEEKDSM